jgi:hypothetical protein
VLCSNYLGVYHTLLIRVGALGPPPDVTKPALMEIDEMSHREEHASKRDGFTPCATLSGSWTHHSHVAPARGRLPLWF